MALFKQQGNATKSPSKFKRIWDLDEAMLTSTSMSKKYKRLGNIEAIENAIAALKNNGLVLKIVEGLQDFLSREVKLSKDKKRAWLRQLHLVKNLEKKLVEGIQGVWNHKTQGMPKFLLVRPMVESERISADDQQEY